MTRAAHPSSRHTPQVFRVGDEQVRAWCSCGWESVEADSYEGAQGLHTLHLDYVAHGPWLVPAIERQS